MKTVSSMADLQALALRTGGEVVASGVHFNAGRQRLAPPKAAPAAPAPAAEPMIPLSQVQQMIAENNERVLQQFSSIIQQLKQTAAAPSQGVPNEWDFEVTYDDSHAITNVHAKAKP